jgi:hypothetical protein
MLRTVVRTLLIALLAAVLAAVLAGLSWSTVERADVESNRWVPARSCAARAVDGHLVPDADMGGLGGPLGLPGSGRGGWESQRSRTC